MTQTATKQEANRSLALLVPNATVFASSFCVMVIELVAGRMVAGNLGSSLYTWTSVIGIVLAGLATGNYVGGRLADRFDVRRTLAALFMLSSAAALSISVADNLVGGFRTLWMLSWPMRVASHVALVFFVPSCLLGMISPVVAKMALDAGYQTGRTIGSVYAWGVVGSILGTFATGFYLIELLGTSTIITSVAIVLAAIAACYQARSWKVWAWLAVLLLTISLTAGSSDAARARGEALLLRKPLGKNVVYYKESQYSYIRVVEGKDDPDQRKMHLDALLHSQINLGMPLKLDYQYEKIFAAITRRLHPAGEPVDHLMIGGGGYVFPRYMEATYRGGRNDVVEIDPEVTRAAQIAFGLAEDSAIHSYHEDARVFVERRIQEKRDGEPVERYDLIYVDAFNHHSVPFQLTTVEFARSVKELLRPNGVYLINLIDSFATAQFLGATLNTLRAVFPEVNVFVEAVPASESPDHRNTFVLSAANHAFDTTDLSKECLAFECAIFPLSGDEWRQLEGKSELVLTDDFAPVENLLVSIVDGHGIDRALRDWQRAIRRAAGAGDHDRAVSLARRAAAIFPTSSDLRSDYVHLLNVRGTALRSQGEIEAAMVEFRRSLALRPEDVRARLGLLDCYRDLGLIEESLPLFEGLLDYDPRVRYNFANTLALLGRLPEAASQFERVTQLQPGFADAYNNWGKVASMMGDSQRARELFELAIHHDPNHADARANLARITVSTLQGSSRSAGSRTKSVRE